MTSQMPILIRPARRDDIPALVAWLNSPALLAATNATHLTPEEQAVARRMYESAILDQSCAIVILDNIRIGAIMWGLDNESEDSRQTIRYLPRFRLDWLRLIPVILNEFSDSGLHVGIHQPLQIVKEPIVLESAKHHPRSRLPYRAPGQRVLLLGPSARNEWPVQELQKHGYSVTLGVHHDDILNDGPFDLVISSGYHLRIPPTICDAYAGKIVNIHAASLPWGRGIGTTLFAILLNYPLGTSIHLIDSGLDTGPILREDETSWTPSDTLRTVYQRLLHDANSLFAKFLNDLADGAVTSQDQLEIDARAYSRTRLQFETVLEVCPLGYDTPLGDIVLLSRAMQYAASVRRAVTTSY